MFRIYFLLLMIALATTWASFKTTDDVHQIALIVMGLFFIILFLISIPEALQLLFEVIFLVTLLLWWLGLRSSLSSQSQRYK